MSRAPLASAARAAAMARSRADARSFRSVRGLLPPEQCPLHLGRGSRSRRCSSSRRRRPILPGADLLEAPPPRARLRSQRASVLLRSAGVDEASSRARSSVAALPTMAISAPLADQGAGRRSVSAGIAGAVEQPDPDADAGRRRGRVRDRHATRTRPAARRRGGSARRRPVSSRPHRDGLGRRAVAPAAIARTNRPMPVSTSPGSARLARVAPPAAARRSRTPAGARPGRGRSRRRPGRPGSGRPPSGCERRPRRPATRRPGRRACTVDRPDGLDQPGPRRRRRPRRSRRRPTVTHRAERLRRGLGALVARRPSSRVCSAPVGVGARSVAAGTSTTEPPASPGSSASTAAPARRPSADRMQHAHRGRGHHARLVAGLGRAERLLVAADGAVAHRGQAADGQRRRRRS